MMREICIHDDDEISLGVFEAVDIGRAQAQLLLSGTEHDFVFPINALKLVGNVQGAIRAPVVNHNDLVIQIVLVQVFDQQPDYQG